MPLADPIADEAVATRQPNMIAAEVSEELVLLNVDSGYFFQLNKTATQIWNLLETPLVMTELYARVGGAFSVDAETCRGDVMAFVVDLRDRGLVAISA